jgi:beta-phosphoglucomutase family hydrolase
MDRSQHGDRCGQGASAGPRSAAATVGLPDPIEAVLFDLDGVLTRTAAVHATAWAETFDELLRSGELPRPSSTRPFSPDDYLRYVDGRARADGVRAFLASRSVTLPEGDPSDGAAVLTVHGVGNRKNEALIRALERDGVEVFQGSVRYLHRAREVGLTCAVVSSSANAREVLAATHLAAHVDVVVDGIVAAALDLPGKPAPDTFVLAAERCGVDPVRAAVIEDALAGVEAGRRGGFGYVVGVDRADQADALVRRGADIVVRDLGELLDR